MLTKRHILGGVLLSLFLLFAGVPARAAQSPGPGQDDTPPSAEDARALSYYHFTMGHHFEEMAGLSRRPDYITRAIEQFKLALQYAPGSHQIAVRLAEAYRRSGRIRDAVQEMQAVLEEDPDRLSARRVLGRIYFQTLGDSPEHARGRTTLGLAIEQYEHVVRLAPEATEDLLTLGRLYRFKNDFASAEETLGRLLDVDPGSEEGMSELAYIYLSRGEHQRAIDLLQGTAVETSSSELLARLAHAYQQKDDLDSAIQISRRALQLDEENIRLRGSLADLLSRARRHEEALAEYKAIEAVDQGNLLVLIRMAQSHRALGQLSEAEEVLDRALRLHPGNLEVALNRAQVKEDLGDFTGSAEILEESLAQLEQPDGRYSDEQAARRAAVLQQLGVLQRRDRQFSEARATLEQMKDLGDRHRYRAWVQIIETYRQERDLGSAVEAARAAREEFDNDVGLAMQLAGVLGESGEVEAALDLVESQEGGVTDPVQLQMTLFQIYERNRMFEQALEAVDGLESIGREGLDAYSQYLRGAIYFRMDDLDRAEEAYRRALELDPDDAGTLNDLGYLLADNNRKLEEALQFVQRAVEAEPNNAAYLDSLAWAHFRLHNMEQAEQYLLQAIDRNSKDPTLYDHLGEIYQATDRLRLAEQAWQRAAQLWSELPANDLDEEERAALENKLRRLQVRLAGKRRSGDSNSNE